MYIVKLQQDEKKTSKYDFNKFETISIKIGGKGIKNVSLWSTDWASQCNDVTS